MNSWKNYLDNNAKVIYGTFEDPSDGHKYRTITIGNQTWMADNYTKDVEGCFIVPGPESDTILERLYSPNAIETLAPEGWHIPTQSEWDELITTIRAVQGDDVANVLRPPFLKDYVNKKDAAFKSNELFVVRCVKNAQPIYHEYQNEKQLQDARAETEAQKKRADQYANEIVNWNSKYAALYEKSKIKILELSRSLKVKDQTIQNLTNELNYYKQLCEELKDQLATLGAKPECKPEPIRQDAEILPSFEKFTDKRDGESYRIVNINGKKWFAQNLRYKGNLSESESCSPNNNSGYDKSFGRLYTQDAARKACPEGWHLPTKLEWEDLNKYMIENYGGNYRKSIVAPILWDKESIDYEGDEEGFSVLPAGYATINNGRLDVNFRRNDEGKIGFQSRFWTDTNATSCNLDDNQERFKSTSTYTDWALSVRYVKNDK